MEEEILLLEDGKIVAKGNIDEIKTFHLEHPNAMIIKEIKDGECCFWSL